VTVPIRETCLTFQFFLTEKPFPFGRLSWGGGDLL